MKLNLGCGRNTKKGFINVDSYERENPLDVICDLVKEFPFPVNSCEYIYAEQLIEHFNWKDGRSFLINCYHTLKQGGTLRLVLPDYKKIFRAYLNHDHKFFEIFKKILNKDDYNYYRGVYENPANILKERPDNPPPAWHISKEPKDRERLLLRVKYFEHNIDVVHWFTHQFGEHLTLWDFKSLKSFLNGIDFKEVKQTDVIAGFDSENLGRMLSSLYVEAEK